MRFFSVTHCQPSKKYLKGLHFRSWTLFTMTFGCWTMLNRTFGTWEAIWTDQKKTTWWLGLTVPTEDIEEFVACAPQMQIQVGPLGAVFEAIHLRWFLHLSRLFCSNFIHMKTIGFFHVFSVIFCQFTRDISLAMALPRRCQASRVFVQGEEEICIGDVATLELRMGFLVSIPGNLCQKYWKKHCFW